MSALPSSNRSHPCPRCGNVSGYCWTFPESGDIACRKDSTGSPREDMKGGLYWVFPADPDYVPPDPADLPSPRPSSSSVLTPDEQHLGYSALLPILILSPHHREGLRARGLDHEDISLAGYRTMPQPWHRAFKVQQLTGGRWAKRLGLTFSEAAHVLPNLAGFYWNEHANPQTRDLSDLRIGGAPGVFIPIRDLAGRIRGAQVRVDERDRMDSEGNDLGKYRFFSDRRGPKPDYYCHVPAAHFRPESLATVRLTEGVLKADVATAHGGVLTLGVPGVDFWPHFLPALAEVRPAVVQVAWDMDAGRKLRVAETLRDLVRELLAKGHTVEVLLWDEADGKGIDDVLQAGNGGKIRAVKGRDALELVDRIVEDANANDPRAEEYRQAREEAARHGRSFGGETFTAEFLAGFRRALDRNTAKLKARRAAERALKLPITPAPGEVSTVAPYDGPSIIQQALERAAEEARKRAEQAVPLAATPHQLAHLITIATADHEAYECRCPDAIGIEYLATGTPSVVIKRCERRGECPGCRLWYNECRMLLLRRFVGEIAEAGRKLYERYIPEEQWESLRHAINDHGRLYGRTLDRPNGHVYVLTDDPTAGAEVSPEIALGEAACLLADDQEACGRRALVSFTKGWGESGLPKPEPKATFVGNVEWHTREVADAINERGGIEETVSVPDDASSPVIRQRVYRRPGGWTEEIKAWFWTCKKVGMCLPLDFHEKAREAGRRAGAARRGEQSAGEGDTWAPRGTESEATATVTAPPPTPPAAPPSATFDPAPWLPD